MWPRLRRTEHDANNMLQDLFREKGPVTRVQLKFDRAGRSDGIAFVTYEHREDAELAIKDFDGANARGKPHAATTTAQYVNTSQGQPIRLSILPTRNPFDTAVMPGRPLSERISAPGGRYTEDDAARRGIDRYIPGGRDRSRSPGNGPRRRGGRRPGARREGGADSGRDGKDGKEGGRGGRGNPRHKKTQDELDADMADYFTKNADDAPAEAANGGAADAGAKAEGDAPARGPGDVDMIE